MYEVILSNVATGAVRRKQFPTRTAVTAWLVKHFRGAPKQSHRKGVRIEVIEVKP